MLRGLLGFLFLYFVVSSFLCLLATWLQIFKVSEFNGLTNPLMFLEDIGSISSNLNFIFSGRY